jgi:LPXTG-site transpeptidase (sortase) family protein
MLAVRLIRAGGRIYAKKGSFFLIFTCLFFAGSAVLGRFGLLPEGAVSANIAEAGTVLAASAPIPSSELPVKIAIPSLSLSTFIENPSTEDTLVLDQGLLKGAVRYPTSAKLGEEGNVVLFGHSSYLPVVYNQAYKTFNGIQKLSAGDEITVYSANAAYTYRVKSVTKESANDAAIPLSVTGKVLTLSTCNSFAEKTDRFVVVANFVESHALLP